MEIVLYESGSKGGNFEYSKYLFRAYAKHADVSNIDWLIPSSTPGLRAPGIYKILRNDRREFKTRILNRLHFLFRTLVNPFILFNHLRAKSKPQYVILNDFEQLTAILWVPVYRVFLRRHRFAIVLHDPDRDAYPPSKGMSAISMRRIMSLIDIALYHEYLPDKPYYAPNQKTVYLNIPHGQYDRAPIEDTTATTLRSESMGYKLISIIGNIRMEKNYELAIEAVARIPGIKLVIAGSPANSSVNVDDLRKLATSLNVSERVVFVVKFLSPSEMNTVVELSDVILLNYKRTFTSQSGIFNLIAPFRKRLIISRTESGLAALAARFGIGHFVKPDDPDDTIRVLREVLNDSNPSGEWDEYLRYASWENHANIVIDAFKKIGSDAV